ncbi:hypothetical protein R1flu_018178 [Riccia fluitans]|uniref:DDE Tnp4 domain-containing protein n=1 Tax=Riccia fluitans TaxID=41844 RepID=A0ABD1ZFD8_9MARC
MQGVPQLNGGFSETETTGVSRPAAVRPFMNLNFGESVNNSALGSRPQPVIQDFAESQVPSSQDPLPDGSVFLDAAVDLTVEVDVLQAGPRHRRQTASGKNASKPPAKEGVKSHFHWHDPAIVALIEAKKEEQDEDDVRFGLLIVLLMMASFTLVLNLLLEDIFEDLSEDEDLRLSKQLKLDTGFSHYEEGSSNLWQNTHWRKPIPVDVKLAACLHRLVLGSSYLLCCDRFGIGASTLQEAMPDVVEAILEDLCPLFLTWPDVVEAICDHDSAFLDISCGAPGSVHDSRCLRLSSIFQRVEAGEVMVDPVVPINDGFQLHPCLLGDQGYAMHP